MKSAWLAPILLAAAAVSPGQAQVGLGLSPMRVEAGLNGPLSGVLTLMNESADKVRVRAELLDFYFDKKGVPQFHRDVAAESAFSCRTHLALNPMEMEMQPGEAIKVRYTLRPPASAEPRGYHCAAGFTTLPTADAPKGMGMQIAVRVVAAFYGVVGNPARQGQVKGMAIQQMDTKEGPRHHAMLEFENAGDVHYRPEGVISVLSEEGATVAKAQLPSAPVLPRRSQFFPAPLDTLLAPGRYTLKATVDLGLGEKQEVVTAVTVERQETAMAQPN